ncbi:MAG: response regulator [Planctomycetaceae bacterium]|nr:response regulator [Planctomycetaceae bacterium]
MARILIVDDAAMDRLLARRLLEKNPEFIIALAEDGAAALEQIEELVPDAVVTDLQMPRVDGLALVESIRRRFPYVPVILMTAHGSEDIAAQALMAGAASYVPKTDLPAHLLDTVQQVLAAARTHRPSHDLLACLDARHFEFQLDNDSRLIPPLVDTLQQAAISMQLVDESGRVQLGVALEEALLQALFRGNLEISADDADELRHSLVSTGRDALADRCRTAPFDARKLLVSATITREEGRFVIRHQGPSAALPPLVDSSDPHAMQREQGRGWVLVSLFMDEVTCDEHGGELRLIKRRKTNTNGRGR